MKSETEPGMKLLLCKALAETNRTFKSHGSDLKFGDDHVKEFPLSGLIIYTIVYSSYWAFNSNRLFALQTYRSVCRYHTAASLSVSAEMLFMLPHQISAHLFPLHLLLCKLRDLFIL